MSFQIDDTMWQPQSAQDHADSIMNRLNRILQENNVTDESGNIIQLTANFSNALYLLALGCGHRFFDNDIKLSKSINSFNLELCDDQQIENLQPIAAIERNMGSYSTLDLEVTANDQGDAEIPAGTRAQFQDVYFVVKNTALIPAGTTQTVPTVCDTTGAIVVLAGEVTGFETQIANVESVINTDSSVPGVNPETTNELRKRLISGNTIKYTLDGCKAALEELTGVSYARIYFNYSTSETLELPGGVILQPRHAYIVVEGDSDQIADVYATYMSAPTQNAQNAHGEPSTLTLIVTASGSGSATIPQGTTCSYNGYTFEATEEVVILANESESVPCQCTVDGPVEVPAYSITEFDEEIANVSQVQQPIAAIIGYDDPRDMQNWMTQSGQSIPIYFDHASEKRVFVKIVLNNDVIATSKDSEEIENQLKRDLLSASSDWGIGEDVTSLLTSRPFADCQYTNVAYTLVSEDGENWVNVLDTGCNIIPRVSETTIEIEVDGDEEI